jgi:hypothetical protein
VRGRAWCFCFFFCLISVSFSFSFSDSPHDLDTLTFLISLLPSFLSPIPQHFFDSCASSNPRKYRFRFRCCFWLLLLHFNFHLGSLFTYIHEFLLSNSYYRHHRNVSSILAQRSTRHSVLLPYICCISSPFFSLQVFSRIYTFICLVCESVF